MTPFLIVVLIISLLEWSDDGSTRSIPQTEQKSEEWEDNGLTQSSNQTPIITDLMLKSDGNAMSIIF